MNMPEEHPLMTRSLFTSSTLTTAFAGTCAIRLYEFGIPFCDIRQNQYKIKYVLTYIILKKSIKSKPPQIIQKE